MKLQGFVGPAYTLDSVNVSAQRCVNLIPVKVELTTGKEGQPYYFKGTPGKRKLLTVGDGPIRCIHRDLLGRVFCASGNKLYQLTESGGTWSATLLSAETNPAGGAAFTFDTSTGIIKSESMSAVGDGTDSTTVFVDGQESYYYWDEIATPDLLAKHSAGQGVEDASHIEWIDGYFIVNKLGTNKFGTSDLANFLFTNGLDFASSEGDPDLTLAVAKLDRTLFVFNERTTEVYSNTGNADFPFERVQGGLIAVGLAAKYSVAKAEDSDGNGILFWLGRTRLGQGTVYMASGVGSKRISTHAIETAIAGYTAASITGATAFAYASGGHQFYQLNFQEASWVFDASTGLWHERAFLNAGVLERDRAEVVCFIPEKKCHLVGDYETGDVYMYDDEYYLDGGATNYIKRLRSSPHISSGGKRNFYDEFILDMEVGIGLETGQGSDPTVSLDFSNDGGHTWSSESFTLADAGGGEIGEYQTRVIWQRLGSSRNRIFRIQISDPVKIRIMGADIRATQGAS